MSFLLQLWEGISSFPESGREGKRIQPVKGWKSCLSCWCCHCVFREFWNEFQHKSICFSFIVTFNTYIRKQYRKVR